jgi:hypothetical protein
MALIDIAIAITPATGMRVCAIANTVVLYVTMVPNHTYWSEVLILNHTLAENSSSVTAHLRRDVGGHMWL